MGEFTRLNEKAPIALSDYAQFWVTPCKRGLASLCTVTKLETRPMEVSWRQVRLFSNLAKPLIRCCRISAIMSGAALHIRKLIYLKLNRRSAILSH